MHTGEAYSRIDLMIEQYTNIRSIEGRPHFLSKLDCTS
jgi:hypothetical protein